MIVVPQGELNGIARRVFTAAGSDEAEAAIVADHLVEANLKGHDSHGVGMIPSYLRNVEAGNAPRTSPAGLSATWVRSSSMTVSAASGKSSRAALPS